ncbi:ATP-binding protein [Streptomyces sp. NPDC029674]|uniref:ATP-binding protein n=1 Tax=Streptomyces sp. NPDC029674 TaxID=3365297 RepID=UPI00384CF606
MPKTLPTAPLTPAWPPDPQVAPYTYTLFCPPLETSPRIARDFVASVLRSRRLDGLVDSAALCTSELVTNACVHAVGVGSLVWLSVVASGVRVTVYDGAPDDLPVMREGYDAESGRGLWLVDAMSGGRWGSGPGAPFGGGGARTGKGVWFELRT